MRYDELRSVLQEHFARLLAAAKDRMAADGPLSPEALSLAESSKAFAELAIETGSGLLINETDSEALIERFIAQYDLDVKKGTTQFKFLSPMLNAAYRDYHAAVMAHNNALGTFAYDKGRLGTVASNVDSGAVVTLVAASEMYIHENELGKIWVAKTAYEKRDHLKLLFEVVAPETDLRSIGKDQARFVKDTLMKYPKNRRKDPLVRHLALSDALELQGIQKLNPQTVNKYLQTYGTMFEWAKRQGLVEENPFQNLTIRSNQRASVVRNGFTVEQAKLIIRTLTQNSDGIVKLSYQKWGPLIGIYTGARLNEIAQIHLSDVKTKDGIWCFDLNDDGEKKLKNVASRRSVPIHDALIQIGLLDHITMLRSAGAKKLFTEFTYCTKNGWGRALGRWFNERFLTSLELKTTDLVFHSLRHTVTNSLTQANVPEPIVQAIVGHTRENMLSKHYLNAGFKTSQLQAAINQLPY